MHDELRQIFEIRNFGGDGPGKAIVGHVKLVQPIKLSDRRWDGTAQSRAAPPGVISCREDRQTSHIPNVFGNRAVKYCAKIAWLSCGRVQALIS